MKMKCLRTVCDEEGWLRNDMVREKCGYKRSTYERAKEGVLKWFEQVKRMTQEGIVSCQKWREQGEGGDQKGGGMKKWKKHSVIGS